MLIVFSLHSFTYVFTCTYLLTYLLTFYLFTCTYDHVCRSCTYSCDTRPSLQKFHLLWQGLPCRHLTGLAFTQLRMPDLQKMCAKKNKLSFQRTAETHVAPRPQTSMMKPSKIPHPGRFPPDVQLELLPFHLCWLPPLQQLGRQELPGGWGRQRQGRYLPGDKKCWELQEFKPPKRRETPCSLHHKSMLLESGAIPVLQVKMKNSLA